MKQNIACKQNKAKSIALGIAIISFGMIYLLYQLNYISKESWELIFNWSFLVVIIGVIQLFSPRTFKFGLLLILIGIAMFIPNVLHINVNSHKIIWPVIVIFIGLLVLYKSIFKRNTKNVTPSYSEIKTITDNENYIEDTAIFGGIKKSIQSDQFKGGSIIAILGGVEIDFSKSKLAPGENIINLTCFLGGVSIKAPAHWNIKIKATTILGGFTDERILIESETDNSSTLIINGLAFLGGGELKK